MRRGTNSRAVVLIHLASATLIASACGPTSASLVEQQRYPEACALSADGDLNRADEMRIGNALAGELGLVLEAQLLTAAEAEARFGMPPSEELRFISYRYSAQTARFGGSVRASARVYGVPARNGVIRDTSISILQPDDVFPPPDSLTLLPTPAPYVRQVYEPTPRPEVRYTGGRGPNALERGVSGVASALTFGLVRRSTGTAGSLTPASRRAMARWEEENAEPKRLFDLEQDRLVAEDAEARAAIRARNEAIPAERAAFEARRSELIRQVSESSCEGDGWAAECEEIRVFYAEQLGRPSSLSISAHLRFAENGCGMTLYLHGADADGVEAAISQPVELYSVGRLP